MQRDSTSQQTRACTIIIATLGRTERAASLQRAIASVANKNEAVPEVLVVVNGTSFDPDVVTTLEKRTDIRVLRIPQPSLPNAILVGRSAVQTPYFGFLDDDDEYLPGAIDRRLEILEADLAADLVITNGVRRIGGEETLAANDLRTVETDPLAALFDDNWLASCNALFRTKSVPVSMFEDGHAFVEWTWLAFRLVLAGLKIRAINEPTFVINDTPTSASKSPAYIESTVRLYQRFLAQPQRPDIHATLKRRLAMAHHCLADYQMSEGLIAQAWRNHLSSLREPGGLQYLSFSARLAAASIGLRLGRAE